MMVSFGKEKKGFQFYEVLFIVSLSVHVISILFRKSFPVPISSSLFPIFSSVSYRLTSLRLRPIIHLRLSFLWGNKYGSIYIVLHVVSQFDSTFVENAWVWFFGFWFSFLLLFVCFQYLWLFVRNQVPIGT